MKTAAVIAEYNPFHNGHQYQLEETRKETGADFLLVVMSGNFVQRGAPAIVNKYARTKTALLGGADVVIELPALYALSSAEFFAGGAVTLLNRLNVVDFLSFGSESGNIALLESCARILAEKEAELNSAIMPLLKNGVSYPAAREQALAAAVSGLGSAFASDISPETLTGLLGSPNNILGLEYCKALFSLRSNIRPFTLKRTDRGYHDTALSPCDISGSGADGNCVSIPGPASGSAAAAGTSLGLLPVPLRGWPPLPPSAKQCPAARKQSGIMCLKSPFLFSLKILYLLRRIPFPICSTINCLQALPWAFRNIWTVRLICPIKSAKIFLLIPALQIFAAC